MSLITENISDFISNAKCDMVTMYGDYIDSLRTGEDCGCDYRKAQKLGRLIKSLEGYTPEGQFYTESVPATATLDFSLFDFTSLQDGMTGTLDINFSDGTVLELVDISGDFAGFTNTQYVDFIIAQINTVSGWYAAYGDAADTIFIVCPAQYGATINTATVTMNYGTGLLVFNLYTNTSYSFVALCAINSPGSNKDQYVVAASEGNVNTALILAFHHTENATYTYTTGETRTAGTAVNACYNPVTDKIYVSFVNGSGAGRIAIVTFNAATGSCSHVVVNAPIDAVPNYRTKPIFNDKNNCVYFKADSISISQFVFIKIESDSVTAPTVTHVPLGPILNVARNDYNKTTGNIVFEGDLNYLYELDYLTESVSTIVDGSTIPSYACQGVSYAEIGGSWYYILFLANVGADLVIVIDSGGLASYSIPTSAWSGVMSYSQELNLISFTSGSGLSQTINFFDFSLLATSFTSALYTFPSTTAFLPYTIDVNSLNALVFSINSASTNSLTDFYYLGSATGILTLSGFFSGGVSQVEIPAEDGCLDDTKSRTVYDKIKSLAGLCGSCDGFTPDTITPHNAFGELTGEGTFLIDDSGTYIVDENNNYILQG